jgi:hypothetical protein
VGGEVFVFEASEIPFVQAREVRMQKLLVNVGTHCP